jgi:uncharacterized Zn finger protein (UPF0148 family)
MGNGLSRSLALKAKATKQVCPTCGAPLWETYDEDGEVDGYHCFRLTGELHSFTVKELSAIRAKPRKKR